jgi:hypothetical protein
VTADHHLQPLLANYRFLASQSNQGKHKGEKENNENFLRKGKIQIQSEGAECWYKDIKIKALTKLPKEIADQL